MRQWASGVTIVSTIFENIQHGMTVSSFTSISLAPPIIMVSIQRGSRTFMMIKKSRIFGICILDASQREISERFAGQTTDLQDRFSGLDFTTLITGSPFLLGGLAYLDCRVRRSIDLGGNSVYFGEVIAAQVNLGGSPLLYFDRRYHGIGNEFNRTKEGPE